MKKNVSDHTERNAPGLDWCSCLAGFSVPVVAKRGKIFQALCPCMLVIIPIIMFRQFSDLKFYSKSYV